MAIALEGPRHMLIPTRRRSNMPATHDVSSIEIRADTMNMVKNSKIARRTKRRMQMPQTRMPIVAFA